MTFEEIEASQHLTPQDKLEFAEFQELTSKFREFCFNKEQKELTNQELFELISDNPYYQQVYKRIIGENDTKEALRIFLSTDLSLIEDKKILLLAKSWRII